MPGTLVSLRTLTRPRTWCDARLAITSAVVAGVVLRLAAWAHNRSLWLDEVYLALNITGRSFAGLWQPLDHDQGAPVGFLMLAKLVTLVFGTSELALRLVPLAAGLAAMLLFPRVAGRLLPPSGAAFATALFAVTPKLIYYASELKQYSSDVFIALVILDLALRPWGVRPRPIPLGRFAVVGAVAVWFSHPALFMLAGLGLVLAVDAVRSRDWQQIGRLALVGAAWLASFAVCYVLSLRELGHNQFLLTYWTEYFAPVPPRNFEQLGWYARAAAWLFEGPAGMNVADVSVAVPALLLFGFGVVQLARSRVLLAAGLLAPLAVALVASALGRYPFGGRLLLFAVPLLHLGLGAAARPGGLGTALCAVVLTAPALTAVQNLVRPRDVEESRPTFAYLRDHWQSGDGVYLSSMAAPTFDFYGRRFGLDVRCVLGRAPRGDWTAVREGAERLRGRPRVWVFVTHERGPDHKFLTWQFEQLGMRTDKFVSYGASLYLYDLSRPPERSTVTEERPTATLLDASPLQR